MAGNNSAVLEIKITRADTDWKQKCKERRKLSKGQSSDK